MTLLAIPNISEGSDGQRIASLVELVTASAARVLDVHSDADHGRTVFTATGTPEEIVEAMTRLAAAAASIDMSKHEGVHPRLGGLDVCPFVPHDEPMTKAVAAARETAERVGAAGIPVYLYGAAAPGGRSLPEIRKGGLPALIERAAAGFYPDAGPSVIDPSIGVVCVGARDVLIAFNVWVSCDLNAATAIAGKVRTRTGGLPGIRALALEIESRGMRQISMNLIEPATTGMEAAFEAVVAAAPEGSVVATEIVGLVPERFMPDPDAEVARLLIEPGHSLEAELLR
jgi:glutamate formiminotransferase